MLVTAKPGTTHSHHSAHRNSSTKSQTTSTSDVSVTTLNHKDGDGGTQSPNKTEAKMKMLGVKLTVKPTECSTDTVPVIQETQIKPVLNQMLLKGLCIIDAFSLVPTDHFDQAMHFII